MVGRKDDIVTPGEDWTRTFQWFSSDGVTLIQMSAATCVVTTITDPTVTLSTDGKTVTLSLTAAQTVILASGIYPWEVAALDSRGKTFPLWEGYLTVAPKEVE